MIDWKPLMTRSEAEVYTRNSYYFGQSLYHGTSKLAANSIITFGLLLSSNRVNSYGEGCYFTFGRLIAISYAVACKNPTLITAKVNVKNPKKFTDSIDFDDFLDHHRIPFDDLQAKMVTQILIAEGYDAIEVGGDWILVIILDRKQIAVFSVEEL